MERYEYRTITLKEWHFLKPYMEVYYSTHKYPVYNSSLLVMLEKEYSYIIFDKCLLIVHIGQMYGKYFCSCLLPPISLKNNIEQEKEMIWFLNEAGFKFFLSEEDFERYGKILGTKDTGMFDDYIYDSKQILEANGREYSDLRRRSKQVNKYLVDNGYIVKDSQLFLSVAEVKRVGSEIHKNWCKRKEVGRNIEKAHNNRLEAVLNLRNYVGEGDYILNYYCNDAFKAKIPVYSIFDKQRKDFWTANIVMKDYSDPVVASLDFDFYMFQQFAKVAGETMINYGLAGYEKGLAEHKRRLRPCKMLHISELPSKKHYIKEYFNEIFVKVDSKIKRLF